MLLDGEGGLGNEVSGGGMSSFRARVVLSFPSVTSSFPLPLKSPLTGLTSSGCCDCVGAMAAAAKFSSTRLSIKSARTLRFLTGLLTGDRRSVTDSYCGEARRLSGDLSDGDRLTADFSDDGDLLTAFDNPLDVLCDAEWPIGFSIGEWPIGGFSIGD